MFLTLTFKPSATDFRTGETVSSKYSKFAWMMLRLSAEINNAVREGSEEDAAVSAQAESAKKEEATGTPVDVGRNACFRFFFDLALRFAFPLAFARGLAKGVGAGAASAVSTPIMSLKLKEFRPLRSTRISGRVSLISPNDTWPHS